jgi:hypothetical protein
MTERVLNADARWQNVQFYKCTYQEAAIGSAYKDMYKYERNPESEIGCK